MQYGGATPDILLRRAAKNDWLLGLFLGFLPPNVESSVDTAPVPPTATPTPVPPPPATTPTPVRRHLHLYLYHATIADGEVTVIKIKHLDS